MGVEVNEVGTGHRHSFHIPTPSTWDRADQDRVVGTNDTSDHPRCDPGTSGRYVVLLGGMTGRACVEPSRAQRNEAGSHPQADHHAVALRLAPGYLYLTIGRLALASRSRYRSATWAAPHTRSPHEGRRRYPKDHVHDDRVLTSRASPPCHELTKSFVQ